MRAIAAIRSSGALWFVPVLFALGTAMPVLNQFARTGYVVSDLSSAGIALSYNAPLLAGFTAFFFRGRSRFHRPLRSNRAGLSSLLTEGWPLLLGGPTVTCFAAVITARAVPTDVVAWQVMATDFSVLLACAMLGAGLSWALPVVIAVPAATMGTFLWINYLPATRSPLLHYLTPTFDGFAQSSRPAASGIAAVLILTGSVCLGMGACVGRRNWDRTAPLLAAPMALAVPAVALGLTVGSLKLSGAETNLMVAEPRTSQLECATHDRVRVCLWPEAADSANEVSGIATSMNAHLTEWGLPAITRIGQGGLLDGAVDVEASPQMSDLRLRYSVARGYLRQRIGCRDSPGPLTDVRIVVLVLAAGTSATELNNEFSRATLDQALEVIHGSTSPEDLGAWYTRGLTKIPCAANP